MYRIIYILLMFVPVHVLAGTSGLDYNSAEVLNLLDDRLSFYGALLVGTLSVFSGVVLLMARWLLNRYNAIDNKIEAHIQHTDSHIDDIYGRITSSCNDVTEKIHSHEIDVARVYAPRSEITDNIDRAVGPMKQRIDEIYDLVLYQARGGANG